MVINIAVARPRHDFGDVDVITLHCALSYEIIVCAQTKLATPLSASMLAKMSDRFIFRDHSIPPTFIWFWFFLA